VTAEPFAGVQCQKIVTNDLQQGVLSRVKGTIRRLEVREQAIIRQISGQLLCDKPVEQLSDDGQVGDWPV